MEYFDRLRKALALEKAADRQSWLQLTRESTAAERRANGSTWYPIAIRSVEPGRGDYLSIEVERTTHLELPHLFRAGMKAALFSQHDATEDRMEGSITWLSGNQLRLSLTVDELPDWTRRGKLGLDLLFDENSYEEMEKALEEAAKRIDQKESGRLLRILTGQEAPRPLPETKAPDIPALNAAQCRAVAAIRDMQDIIVLHGPPGTGKTTTLVQAIKISATEGQVLAVAPSNAAVDLLSEKLAAAGLKVVRIGNPARVAEKQLALTLDRQMAAHPQMKQVRQYRKQAAEYRNLAQRYKRNFGKAERDQRKALFDEAAKLMKEVQQTENHIATDLLDKAQVITATLVGAAHYTLGKRRFHRVFMDEAGQALEPAAWIAVLRGDQLVLAGDHHQLAPTVKSEAAAAAGLSQTLLEKMAAAYPERVFLLDTQYRMHETIMAFPSRLLYENKLQAAPQVAKTLLFPGDQPFLFIDTAGCGFEEKKEGTGTSNPEEADLLIRHLEIVLEKIHEHHAPENFPSIGIVSPYRLQVDYLQEKLAERTAWRDWGEKLQANTIDSFQGQERDLMYISLTRSNARSEIGFLSDIRRLNVAMTRARKKLVVLGDSATLGQLPFFSDLLHYAQETGGYDSAWSYLYAE